MRRSLLFYLLITPVAVCGFIALALTCSLLIPDFREPAAEGEVRNDGIGDTRVSASTPRPAATATSTEVLGPSPTLPPPAPTSTEALPVLTTAEPTEILQTTFSHLDIGGISVQDGLVAVTGTTDLPDGAVLDVTFDIAEYGSPQDLYVGVSTRAEVAGGQFSALIEPPRLEEFLTGMCQAF